jgi:hypothetical protein
LSVQYRAYVLFLVAQYSTNILRKALFKWVKVQYLYIAAN